MKTRESGHTTGPVRDRVRNQGTEAVKETADEVAKDEKDVTTVTAAEIEIDVQKCEIVATEADKRETVGHDPEGMMRDMNTDTCPAIITGM